MNQIVQNSKDNKKSILNVCVSYTARNEMCHAMQSLASQVQLGQLQPSDITEELFEKNLYQPLPADLLIRTSGEIRLSDFLLWQTSFSCIVFLNVLWPDFSAWHLYWAIILYQKNFPNLIERRKAYQNKLENVHDLQTFQSTDDQKKQQSQRENSEQLPSIKTEDTAYL